MINPYWAARHKPYIRKEARGFNLWSHIFMSCDFCPWPRNPLWKSEYPDCVHCWVGASHLGDGSCPTIHRLPFLPLTHCLRLLTIGYEKYSPLWLFVYVLSEARAESGLSILLSWRIVNCHRPETGGSREHLQASTHAFHSGKRTRQSPVLLWL